MSILITSVGDPTGSFTLDGVDYPKGEFYVNTLAEEDIYNGSPRVRIFYGITEIGDVGGETLVYPQLETEYTVNGVVGVADLATLLSGGGAGAYDDTAVVANIANNGADIVAIQAAQVIKDAEIVQNTTDIDAIEVVLATVQTSALDIDVRTTSVSLVAGDLKDDKIISLNYAAEDFTIEAGIAAVGDSVKINYDDAGTGDANIVNGTNVDIVGYTDGISLASYPSGLILARKNSNITPEEWYVVEFNGTLADYTSCTIAANEINRLPSASVSDICNESTATAGSGMETNEPTKVTLSASIDSNTGTYALSALVDTTADNKLQFKWNGTIADEITVTGFFKAISGTGMRFRTHTNLTIVTGTSSYTPPTGYTSQTWTFTVDATGECIFNMDLAGFAATAGVSELFVDGFSVTKTN